MKILHVNFSDNYGGAAIAVMRIHKLLLKNKIDSNLLVSDKILNQPKTFSINKTSEKLKNIIKGSINRNLKFFFKSKNKTTHSLNIIPSSLLYEINKFNADIVNLHWIGNETISISQINKIKAELVWTLHDMWPFCGAEHYTNNKRFEYGYKLSNKPTNETGLDINRYIWEKKTRHFKKIEKIIVSSSWMKNAAKKSFLFKDKQITEIPLPIDVNNWNYIKNNKYIKKLLKIEQNKKIIVFGSDNYLKNERKGLKFYLNLVKKLNKEKYQFIVFGEDNHEEFNSYLEKFNIEKKVLNMGKLKDELSLKIFYSSIDLLILPSVQESFGLIAQEGSIMGVPSVVFNNTGLTSIIDHKKNGYLSKSNSNEDIYAGAKWCLNNLNRYKVSIYSKKKFNEKNIIKNYLKFLKN
jgi:glycosyltransferase involved in cell wall biosynthesis